VRLGHGQRALAVGAHPDDTEFGCYGVIQRFDEREVLVLSAGERGGPPVDRQREADEAATAISAKLEMADEPDTAIAAGPAITRISEAIRRFQPDVVFCPSRQDDHQDHATTAQACYIATRSFRGIVLGYLTPSAVARFAPQVVLGISDEEWATKLVALGAHRSQAHRAYLSPTYVETTARYWAQQAGGGMDRAEPFELIRWVQGPP
jgi:LmbE family N-acetylglucosaminyl deacetylase